MKPKKLDLDVILTRLISYLFALLVMAGFLYLIFTKTWFLMSVAILNSVVVSGIAFMLAREGILMFRRKEDE